MFSLLLADSGALVACCRDLDAVLRVLASRYCRLCVMSQTMAPDMREVLKAVRKASPDTKLLLVANRDDVDAVLPLFAQGLNDAILQPINPKRAVAALQGLLGTAALPESLPAGGTQSPFVTPESVYRPLHLTARSPAMRRAVNELWAARTDPIGVILRGEPGTEYELLAREYQAMDGDASGYVVVLSHQDLDVESLATQVSLNRLNEGVSKTYFVPEVEKLPKAQGRQLLEFLRRIRKERGHAKPLRMVLSASERPGGNDAEDGELFEALQFIVPSVVSIPPLRERREDIALIVRRVLLDLTAVFPAYRARSLHPAALQWLCGRPWKGNFDELAGVIRRVVMDCGNREISAGHFGNLTETPALSPVDPDEVAAARVLAAVQNAAGYLAGDPR